MKLRIGKHPRELHAIKFQLNNTRNIIWQKTTSFHDKTLQVALLSLVTIF